jgi:hypothetical protein
MKNFAELVHEAVARAYAGSAPFVPSRAVLEDAMLVHVVRLMLDMPYAEMKTWVMQTFEFDAGSQALAVRLYKLHAAQF